MKLRFWRTIVKWRIICSICRTPGLPIEVHEYDLKDAIPKKFFGKYDVFMADPPEGYESLMLYLKRGLALLRPGEG
ncbi:MAG TPA: putative methyltransferase, partial [Bacteroidetes bacterium]|nr:putative methyltransferase [Bacteroidota bacterium]